MVLVDMVKWFLFLYELLPIVLVPVVLVVVVEDGISFVDGLLEEDEEDDFIKS